MIRPGFSGEWGRNKLSVIKRLWADSAVRYAVITFLVLRIFLTVWAVIVLTLLPLPAEPDEEVRPYLGEPQLAEGPSGTLLGPWQRFDTLHYLRIARQGYAAVPDSVFPPIYPYGMRLIGSLIPGSLILGERSLSGGLILSNLACIGLFFLLYKVTATTFSDEAAARRAVLFLAVFPASFFLLAGYSESLFILLALGSFWSARRGRFWLAGLLGFLAALTRLTGWILVVPLAYEFYSQRLMTEGQTSLWPVDIHGIIGRLRGKNLVMLTAVFLPALGLLTFFALRGLLEMPPLKSVYEGFWHQSTGIPGWDLVTAVQQILSGNASFVLYLDFLSTFFLLGTTILAFRRLGPSYGLYSAALLFFMLLPAADQKPLFSFMRYTLAFFPTFMILADAAKNPWINRLIFYPSVALMLYLSGQFFVWGWVA
ncbi:MAG: mannosyltransferase family protein [Candidatus Promineifilaceae bacterium]